MSILAVWSLSAVMNGNFAPCVSHAKLDGRRKFGWRRPRCNICKAAHSNDFAGFTVPTPLSRPGISSSRIHLGRHRAYVLHIVQRNEATSAFFNAKGRRLMAWNLLFTSDIGLLSLFTIVFILGMAVYLIRYASKHSHDEEKEAQAANIHLPGAR
jgi:hypothetical protein